MNESSTKRTLILEDHTIADPATKDDSFLGEIYDAHCRWKDTGEVFEERVAVLDADAFLQGKGEVIKQKLSEKHGCLVDDAPASVTMSLDP